MKKQKVYIERELKSNSKGIIWKLISSAEGLQRWVADSVTEDGKQITFKWGDDCTCHAMHTATVLEKVKFRRFRFKWDGSEDPEEYVELKLEKSEITDDFMLCITDFAEPGETDSIISLWHGDLDRLHRSSGL